MGSFNFNFSALDSLFSALYEIDDLFPLEVVKFKFLFFSYYMIRAKNGSKNINFCLSFLKELDQQKFEKTYRISDLDCKFLSKKRVVDLVEELNAFYIMQKLTQ
jgi:hypothetical protein